MTNSTTNTLTGRALDFEVGRVVLGYYAHELAGRGFYIYGQTEDGTFWPISGRYKRLTSIECEAWELDTPAFSTSHDAAFTVVAAMQARGWEFELTFSTRGYYAAFWEPTLLMRHRFPGEGTAPEAIAQAALRALAAGAADGEG